MWDNPYVLHTAINDYPNYRRVMYRTTVEGTVPLAAAAARKRVA
jgi:taurine dioxygenase